jgi:hypothetical protein
MSTEYVLPSMESFGALNGEERDSVLLQALTHAGGQFGVMQEELGNLRGENRLLREDNVHSQHNNSCAMPSSPWEEPLREGPGRLNR